MSLIIQLGLYGQAQLFMEVAYQSFLIGGYSGIKFFKNCL